MKKSNLKKVNKILNSFNFSKVHDAMILLNWRWMKDEHSKGHIPGIKELKETAKDLLVSCLNNNYESISTGGFHVARRRNIRNSLRLSFELESCSLDDFE